MLRTVRVNPQTSTKDLQHDLAADGVTVHRSTIRCTLHKEMLYGRVMQRKPFLRPHHKQSCLRLSWSDSEWQCITFSDESRFCLGGDDQQICVVNASMNDLWSRIICPEVFEVVFLLKIHSSKHIPLCGGLDLGVYIRIYSPWCRQLMHWGHDLMGRSQLSLAWSMVFCVNYVG
ncbi:hypothetical protein NFI96_033389 [Prochilodus magdalenae]|nr:hypothetical protein NFI96_033389 [Prochilodus magdalenae]